MKIDFAVSSDEKYFVVGRTFTGARFYSNEVDSLIAGYALFKNYCDIVLYFGGGEVELFYQCDIIKKKIVL